MTSHILATGPAGALRYLTSVTPDGALATWSADRAKASRFGSCDMAEAFQRMLVAKGEAVMVIAEDEAEDRRVEHQREHQRRHAEAMAGLNAVAEW